LGWRGPTPQGTSAALRLSILAGVFLAGLAGCGDPQPGPQRCGDPGPAFLVTVSSPEPSLPADLEVTAHYGAGEESYRLTGTVAPSEVLFCSTHAAGGASQGGSGQGGGSGNPPSEPAGGAGLGDSLRCELWTDSSVSFRVSSGRFAELEEELKPMVDRCGVVTTQHDFVLEYPGAQEN
jgi:hypothetical protein